MSARRSAFAIGLALSLGLYLAACLFVNPAADDFIYASNARNGFVRAWIQEYVGWNGRYASNALLLLVPLPMGLGAYRVAAMLMVASTAVVYALMRALGGAEITRSDTAVCSAAFCALFLSQSPSIGDSVYWYTAAATYQMWIVPVILYLTLFAHRSAAPRRADRWRLPLAVVLLIVAAGFNEVVTLMLLVFHAAWLLWSFKQESSDRTTPGVLLGVTVLCALCMLLSPGNAVRQSMYTGVRHQLLHSAAWTVLQTLRFGADWLSNGALLVATLLFVPFGDALSRRWQWDRRRAAQMLKLLLTGMAIVVPIAVFPAYWETGTLGQHRTIASGYMVFLLLWFAAVPVLLAAAPRHADALKLFTERWRAVLAALLIVALAVTRNSYALASDLISGRLASYDRAMRDRFARLETCHDQAAPICDIDPLRDPPASFVTTDVSPNAGHWVNVAYARYFRVPEVRGRSIAVSDHVRH